jgi:hypothetical protein
MGHGHVEIKNPGSLKIESSTKGIFIGMAAIGSIGLAASIFMAAPRGWSALLLNHFFFMSLALGGLFITAIQFMTGAMWSAPIRRLSESFSAYIPVILIGFILICVGNHELFKWTHPEHVKGDIILEHKQGYLNMTFFAIRNVIAIALWYFLGKKIVGHSTAQDADGSYEHTAKNKVFSPIFVVVFAITFTMASIDLLMSLDPHWFSTMFGVYTFSGLFTSSLAMTTIFAIVLIRKGVLKDIVNENHLHDLGKFMFAFTVFWAYIAFSQYMLIWYANLPEETMYFMHRSEGGWKNVSIFLFFAKFIVPFFALLPREAKRSMSRLMKVAIWMLFAHWVDLIWIIQPEFFREGPRVGLPEVAGLLAFGGLFGLLVTNFLSKHNVVAIKDPKLAESVLHHHQ